MSDAEIPRQIADSEAGGNSVTERTYARAYDPQVARPFRFSLRSLLLLMAAAALVSWGARVGYQRAQQNMLEQEIRNGLRWTFLALRNHDSARGVLPPSIFTDAHGTPLSSWRFKIFPYIEKSAYPFNLQAAWNSPPNRQLAKVSTSLMSWRGPGVNTNIFAIAGTGTAFDAAHAARHRDFPKDLILFMEIADSNTHWMQPGDYDVATLLAATGRLGDTVKSLLPDRIHLLFADGEVWALSPDTPVDAVKPFFTIADAKAASWEQSLSKYRVDE